MRWYQSRLKSEKQGRVLSATGGTFGRIVPMGGDRFLFEIIVKR